MTRAPFRARMAAALLIATVMLAGCAGTGDHGARGRPGVTLPSMPTSAPVYVTGDCTFTAINSLVLRGASQTPPQSPGPGVGRGGALPEGFAPVSVISCGQYADSAPGKGEWTVATRRTSAGSIDDLVSAYRMPAPVPSMNPDTPVSCTANLDTDPTIAFVDATGTAVWPAPPRDVYCGHISARVTNALDAMKWQVTKYVRIAPRSGCSLKDMDLISQDPPRGPLSRTYFARRPQKSVTLCVYGTTGTPAANPTGQLQREVDITGAGLGAAVTALESAPAAGPCAQQPTRFATIMADADLGTGAVGTLSGYLELDGCHRFGLPDTGGPAPGGLRQLTADQVAALLAAG